MHCFPRLACHSPLLASCCRQARKPCSCALSGKGGGITPTPTRDYRRSLDNRKKGDLLQEERASTKQKKPYYDLDGSMTSALASLAETKRSWHSHTPHTHTPSVMLSAHAEEGGGRGGVPACAWALPRAVQRRGGGDSTTMTTYSFTNTFSQPTYQSLHSSPDWDPRHYQDGYRKTCGFYLNRDILDIHYTIPQACHMDLFGTCKLLQPLWMGIDWMKQT